MDARLAVFDFLGVAVGELMSSEVGATEDSCDIGLYDTGNVSGNCVLEVCTDTWLESVAASKSSRVGGG